MKLIFYMLFSALSLLSCAQRKSTNHKSVIKNSYAYISVRHAGTIAVDDNGRPLTRGVDTSYVIFVEVPATANISWQKGWINNAAFTLSASPVNENSLQVGYGEGMNKPIVLKASAGNKLWRIDVQGHTGEAKNNKVATGELQLQPVISLEGVYNRKKFVQVVQNRVQLRTVQGV